MAEIIFEAVSSGVEGSYEDLALAVKDRRNAGLIVNSEDTDKAAREIAALIADDVGEMILGANSKVGG